MSVNDDAGLRKPLTIVTWVEFGIAMLLFYARWYSAWRIIHCTAADIYLATATFVRAVVSFYTHKR